MEIKNLQKIKETIKLQGFILTIFWLIVLPLTVSAKELGWVILFYAIPVLFILLIIFLFNLINLAFFKEEEIEIITKSKPTFLDNKIISFMCKFFFVLSFGIPFCIFFPIIVIIFIIWIIYMAFNYKE